MKTTKKFLSILLATILILSLFPVSLAHASDNTITFSAEADKVDAKAGDIVNVDICMSENSVVAALTLIVNYDNTALKILNVQSKEAFGYEEFNTAYGNNKLAYLTASANPKTVGGTLFTIQFEVLKDGCTEISLSVDELTDIDLNPLSSATESAKIHNFDNGTVTQPTCTDQGYTTYTCACGYSYVEDYVDATGHSHTSEITTPATHLADGVMTFTCHCGDSYTEVIEKIAEHNHNAVVTPPTCTAQGFTTYTCECGDTYVADYVNANGHSYNPTVTPPTCTEGGYTTYTCTVCDDTYVDDETSATGHSYTSEITKPATHTENGVMTYTCACGDTYTETINATGDHYHVPSVTAPTCTEGGYTTYTCVCGDIYVGDETPAIGHDYDYDNGVLVRPRENRNGYYMYFCKNDAEHMIFESVESADYTEYDKAVEKLGEYLVNSNLTDEAKEFIVSGCVEIIKNNDEFYEDGIRERRDLIASEQHIIDKVTNELNEHYQVVDSFIANCEAGNHDVKEYISDDNATCTANGTKRGACYYCGTEVVADDENNSALGHDIVVDNAVAPDCINTGLTEGSHCSRCDGATTEQEVVPALGHSYENGICTVCDNADPDYYVFSVKAPSRTKIRNKDGIVLHTEIAGNQPDGSFVEWTSNNNNFSKTVMNDGESLQVIANNKGNTTFTATLYDANGNVLATDTVELYSQSGFFDKIGGFFRSLFGTTKIYEI